MIFKFDIAKIVPRSLLLIFFGIFGFVTCEFLVADQKPDTLTVANAKVQWVSDDDTSSHQSDVACQPSSLGPANRDRNRRQAVDFRFK